ncbi:MAG TPA: hypothetical protein VK186_08375 [Candidatus Deferrimicrobium sp.]|nr:hypothetical protein [Candidatus Deferrimicrobium sp.]
MIEVAMSQGKVENAIYNIPQLKSSLFDKKNQIFLKARSEVGSQVGSEANRFPGISFSFQCLRFFDTKLTNHEIVNPQVNFGITRFVRHAARRK